jgi:cell division protein FtsQ
MKIRLNRNFKKGSLIFFGCLAIFAAIGLVEKQQNEKVCNRVVVNIDNQYDNYFISESDILSLVSDGGREQIVGRNFNELPLKTIEARIKANKFVEEVEVFKDLRGNLIVKAGQSQPLARVIQESGPDAYIDRSGKVLPVSERFTARVILVGGDFTPQLVKRNLYATEEGMEIFQLLKFITEDEFWRAQISAIYIDKNREITMYPQVSKQVIEFGKPEDIETKFKKLKIFYKEILPQKGWNNYEKVNLKYHNQIVCE